MSPHINGQIQYHLHLTARYNPMTKQASASTLGHLSSLKTMESLQNGVVTHFKTTLLFSTRTQSLASLQSCHRIDSDVQCKWTLTFPHSTSLFQWTRTALPPPMFYGKVLCNFCFIASLGNDLNFRTVPLPKLIKPILKFTFVYVWLVAV